MSPTKKFLIVAAVALIASVFGCSNLASHVPNSIPAVGSSMDQARAHIDAAESDVQAAIPHADPAGGPILRLASQQHAAATANLHDAAIDLGRVQTQRDRLVKDNDSLTAQVTELLHSWGHRFQVFVTRFLVLLAVLYSIHYVCAGAAAFLPFFFPVILPAVPALSLIAKITNIPGYGTWLAARAHTSYLLKAVSKPGVN